MQQFDVSKVLIGWMGVISLQGGLASGASIQDRPAAARWVYKETGYGDSIPLIQSTRSGVLSLTLMRESVEHFKLVQLFNADVISRSIVGPLVITNTISKEVVVFNKARIRQMPALLVGTNPTPAVWSFLYAQRGAQTFGIHGSRVGE